LFALSLSRVPAQTSQQDKLADLTRQIEALKQAADELRQATPTNAPEAAATPAAPAAAVATNRATDPISRIREEGLEHSQVMQTLSHLTEAIGPRLTGSPNMKRANEWTRDTLAGWGLANAKLEPWGPFGRGWSVTRFSAQIVEPSAFPLVAYPKAWSPGLDRPIIAEVVYLDARTAADLEKYRGKLRDAVVLTAGPREVNPRFEPLSLRMSDVELLRLANISDPRYTPPYEGRSALGGQRGAGPTNEARVVPLQRRGGGGGGFGGANLAGRVLALLREEGAALAVSPSAEGDGGAVFVTSAALPAAGGGRATNSLLAGPRIWSVDAPATVPQMAVSTEDYNRLVRMIREGRKLKMAAEMDVKFDNDDLMAYNTVAEIPGTDLKREVVMIGAHLDSWQAGTGATDNGAGVAATMEAMRILKALDLKPRRTIRIGLWSGEEQGMMGSRAYVSNHFGYFPGSGGRGGGRRGGAETVSGNETNNPGGMRANTGSRRELVRRKEYDTLSVYFNLDHGAGKIRGIYLDGNEDARAFFSKWLQPFADLGAATVTLGNSGGTDHLSFENIGLPGFPFIQDPLDYWTRTHHSSADVYDRVPPDDLKQAATILAAFAYDAAMMEEKVPRKPLP
jgi:hypothetical protein